jgi:Tfp pilus assembly protein PilO
MLAAQKKIFFSILISITILAVILGFLIWPLFSQVKSFATIILTQKSTLKLLQDQVTTLEDFQKNYNLYSGQFQRIANGFVNQEVPLNFIEYLEALGRSNNLEVVINNMGFDSKNKKDALTALDFQVNAKGVVSNSLRFLEQLENGTWFLEIRQMNLEKEILDPDQPKPKESAVSLSLSLSVFAYPKVSASSGVK